MSAFTMHGFCPHCRRPVLYANDGRGNVTMVMEEGDPEAGEPHDYVECRTAQKAKVPKP